MSSSQTPGPFRRLITGLPLALISPILILIAAITLALTDLIQLMRRRKTLPAHTLPNTAAISIVIPNWNGRDLLEKYLPSVLTAADKLPGSEVIVVDNGSEDGSAQFIRERFATVRLITLDRNLGFGGGSNIGFRAAKHDIVILLNSDMRVDPDFTAPLLTGFTDPLVFSVSCQIFLSDPAKRREETGLTEGWWENGGLRVSHRADAEITQLYPCFYGGGGSCAFDRRKFLELGGFDELLAPFYLEDTDLGYLAWKRGWKNLYQPASIVYHEHRGTIGRKFSETYIQGVLKKNYLLFTWKNIHQWKYLAPHLALAWASSLLSWLIGPTPDRSTFLGLARAALQLPAALRSRSRAKSLAHLDDDEAFRRPMAGYFHDTYGTTRDDADKLNVLFVAPYPISPPIHGGAVFMNQTVRELAKQTHLHLIVYLETPEQRAGHTDIDATCASTAFLVRPAPQAHPTALRPYAVQVFRSRDLLWLIHRQIYTQQIDVIQLEYTMLAPYGVNFWRLPSILFEHDIYFQSISRRLPQIRDLREKITASWEYLRALRFELTILPRFDRIQVCSQDNGNYIGSFLPAIRPRIDANFRAGIDVSRYAYRETAREPHTLLFLGSFRHTPNQEALTWFVESVWPTVLKAEPAARLIIAGSEPPERHPLAGTAGLEFAGFVEDVRDALARYQLFVCPILSGSGVRVKLLEAFAAGIPVVSTPLGAEGLTTTDGEICALADHPETFARRVLEFLGDDRKRNLLARQARIYVETQRDIRVMTQSLIESYRREVQRKSISLRP